MNETHEGRKWFHPIAYRDWLPLLLPAVGLAVTWWLVGLAARGSELPLLVWDDQKTTFVSGLHRISQPYTVAGFVNPPWALVILAPFNLLPLAGAVLAQMMLYFALLAGVIVRFGGGHTPRRRWLALFAVLLSPLALDTALEINIDWIVALGLVLPPAYSGPFLLVKPQDATGIIFSYRWRDFVRWVGVTAAVMLASFVIWGDWVNALIANSRQYPVSWSINLAPQAIIGLPLALLAGAALLLYAFRRRDPVVAALAGLFFVPYLASYSAMVPFTLAAARWPRVMFIVTVALWVAVITVLV